jgi:hypothetical protein
MSATEIILEIKKLPSAEQAQVLAFLQSQQESQEDPANIHYAKDAEFDKATDNVLRERADLFRRLAQ